MVAPFSDSYSAVRSTITLRSDGQTRQHVWPQPAPLNAPVVGPKPSADPKGGKSHAKKPAKIASPVTGRVVKTQKKKSKTLPLAQGKRATVQALFEASADETRTAEDSSTSGRAEAREEAAVRKLRSRKPATREASGKAPAVAQKALTATQMTLAVTQKASKAPTAQKDPVAQKTTIVLKAPIAQKAPVAQDTTTQKAPVAKFKTYQEISQHLAEKAYKDGTAVHRFPAAWTVRPPPAHRAPGEKFKTFPEISQHLEEEYKQRRQQAMVEQVATESITRVPTTKADTPVAVAPAPTTQADAPVTTTKAHATAPTTKAVAPIRVGGAVSNIPQGALNADEYFKLNEEKPLGVKLYTLPDKTGIVWKPYHQTANFNWADKKCIVDVNRWRHQLIRRMNARLGIHEDGRKK